MQEESAAQSRFMADVAPYSYPHRHLLGIEGLAPGEISALLDLSESYVEQSRRADKKVSVLTGRTVINVFFETSTRTRTSFELAGKRLGADVINISPDISAIKKGETLLDTALTLNAMRPDMLVVRHPESGAVHLLAEKVDGAVINAGDGWHEHPTQALLDALTIRRRIGGLSGLTVAICGDIMHSRVARSNIHLFNAMGTRVRVVAPPTLLPAEMDRFGVEVFHDMRAGLDGVDIVMMLRPSDGADAGQLRAVGARVFPFLRPRRPQAGGCAAGCTGDASRADEPGRRDRQRCGRRYPPFADPGAGGNGRRGAHGLPRPAHP